MRTVRGPFLILLLGLLALPLALPQPSADAAPSVLADPHPSITIDGDIAFGDLFTGVRSGSGTATDPYVIADWHIHKTDAWAIRLIDTRAHVVVRDVFIHGATSPVSRLLNCFPPLIGCPGSTAVWIDGAQNVTLERLHIVTDDKGIRIDGAKNILVRDTLLGPHGYIAGGFEYGVYMYGATNVTLDGLDVTSTRWPIAFGRGTDITIRDSTFTGGDVGFGFGDYAAGLELRDNRFAGTSVFAFGTMSDLLVTGNTFSGSTLGFGSGGYPTTRFDRLHVCGNSFTSHSFLALEIPRGGDIRIEGNTFRFNYDAVRVASAVVPPLTFDDNEVTRSSRYGVDLRVTTQTLRDNHFQQNHLGHILAAPATDALDNWWGHASGPSGIGPGSGDRLADLGTGAFYSPWLTAPPATETMCP